MKNFILIISVFFLFSFTSKEKPPVTYHKDLLTGKYYTDKEFEDFCKELKLRYAHPTKKTRINTHGYGMRKTEDSIIYEFRHDIKVGHNHILKSSNEKIYKYIGKEFPVNNFTSIDNKSIALGNKPAVINFWFVKCTGCIEEMPDLNRLQEKYKDKVDFISVTFENEKDVRVFLEKHSFNFDHVVDQQKLIDELEMSIYPRTLYLNKEGRVISIESTMGEDIDIYEDLIEELFEL